MTDGSAVWPGFLPGAPDTKRGYCMSGCSTACGPGSGKPCRCKHICGAQLSSLSSGKQRCAAKWILAAWLEGLVWSRCREFILNPGEYLEAARARLRDRLSEVAQLAERRRVLLEQLAGKDNEKERILLLFRRGHITLAEAEQQLAAIAQETARLRELLEFLKAQEELARAYEAHLTDAAVLLGRLRSELAAIEREDNFEAKRRVVELLIAGITIETEGTGRNKRARITIRYAFQEPESVADSNTLTQGPHPLKTPGSRRPTPHGDLTIGSGGPGP